MFTSPDIIRRHQDPLFPARLPNPGPLVPSCTTNSVSADHCAHLQIIFTYLLTYLHYLLTYYSKADNSEIEDDSLLAWRVGTVVADDDGSFVDGIVVNGSRACLMVVSQLTAWCRPLPLRMEQTTPRPPYPLAGTPAAGFAPT